MLRTDFEWGFPEPIETPLPIPLPSLCHCLIVSVKSSLYNSNLLLPHIAFYYATDYGVAIKYLTTSLVNVCTIVWPLRGINKTAWGAKLILTADLAYPVNCACQSGSPTDGTALRFVCFSPYTAPHPPSPPLPPAHTL